MRTECAQRGHTHGGDIHENMHMEGHTHERHTPERTCAQSGTYTRMGHTHGGDIHMDDIHMRGYAQGMRTEGTYTWRGHTHGEDKHTEGSYTLWNINTEGQDIHTKRLTHKATDK